MVCKPPKKFHHQLADNTEHEYLKNTATPRDWVLELIDETKQKESENTTYFIARLRGLTFAFLQKFTQHKMVSMCLNNFMHDLLSKLIGQTFEGFNDLCTKGHSMEIPNKHTNNAEEIGRAGEPITMVVEPK